MPAALPAHVKSLAQALFMQGLTPKAVALKLQLNPLTVQNWATKAHWVDLRSNLNAQLSQPANILLAREAADIRKRLARQLSDALDELEHTRRSLPDRVGLIESITRSAKTVLGWGDTQSGKGIDVQALSSALPALANQGQLPPSADGQPTVGEQSMLPGDPGSQGADPAGPPFDPGAEAE